MKKIILTGAVLLAIFTGCKKDKDDKQTTAELVSGKWSVSKVIDREVLTNNNPTEFIYTGISADYFDFRVDGMLEASYDDDKDILPYQIQGDTAIVIDGTQLKITTINKSQLSLHEKKTFSGGYAESIYELKR